MSSALHIRLTELGIRIWVEFVPSKANLADEPSRAIFDTIVKLGATQLPFKMPPYETWGVGRAAPAPVTSFDDVTLSICATVEPVAGSITVHFAIYALRRLVGRPTV